MSEHTRILKCPLCGNEWETKSIKRYVTCSNCQRKFDSTKAEIKLVESGLEHFNVDETGVRILDKSLATKNSPRGRIIDVDFQPKRAWCQHCQSESCIHVKYALSVPIVKQTLKRKGWKI